MLRKKEVYTTITPIPSFIPRQLAMDILHSHSEIITLNPLVLEHKPIKAPRDAASDEFYSTWYEITERVQYIPGMGKMGSGKIAFKGCFHDTPWGLQTHVYAPMNVDIRQNYRIDGNQSGYEPPKQHEIGLAGLGAPADGLFLREDIEIKCNIAVVGFVKSQLKAATKEMVSRIIKKAELLDSGVLQAMIEDGKLKTINPADRSQSISAGFSGPPKSTTPTTGSPASQYQQPLSPRMPYQIPRPMSVQPPCSAGGSRPETPGYGQQQPNELVGSEPVPGVGSAQQFVMELPGDYYYPGQPSPHRAAQPSPGLSQPSPGLPQPSPALSQHSDPGAQADWRQSVPSQASGHGQTRPMSLQSQPGSNGLGASGFINELPTHAETKEEYQVRPLKTQASKGTWKLDPAPRSQSQQQQTQPPSYTYNPRDYANVGR